MDMDLIFDASIAEEDEVALPPLLTKTPGPAILTLDFDCI